MGFHGIFANIFRMFLHSIVFDRGTGGGIGRVGKIFDNPKSHGQLIKYSSHMTTAFTGIASDVGVERTFTPSRIGLRLLTAWLTAGGILTVVARWTFPRREFSLVNLWDLSALNIMKRRSEGRGRSLCWGGIWKLGKRG